MPFARKQILLVMAASITVIVLASLFFFTNSNPTARTNPTIASATATILTDAIGSTPSPSAISSSASALTNLGFENGLSGWVAGYVTRDSEVLNQGYTVNISTTVAHSGKASAYIQPTIFGPKQPPPKSYGYISTRVLADTFRGKRVRFSAYLRTQDEVESGLWMNVVGTIDGKPTDPAIPMAWDNMLQDRNVDGTTDWHQYNIVLDIPLDADFLLIGLQAGYGQLWMDDVQLEVVGSDVQLTRQSLRRQLDNLDFEQGLSPWQKQTLNIGQIDIGTSSEMAYNGKYAAYIRQTGGDLDGGAALIYSLLYGGDYRDKRIQLSAYMNVDKAPRGAGISLWAYYLDANGKDAPPITSTATLLPTSSGLQGWQKVELAIDVPDRASAIVFNMGLIGDGELWIDDVQLTVLGPVSATATPEGTSK